MKSLTRLEFLNISFNVIQKLDGFVEMHGPKYRLKYLDLKGNNISNMKELSYLTGCNKLKDLIIRTTNGQQDNLVSKSPQYEKTVFDIIPQLLTLDGFDFKKRPVDVDNGSGHIPDFLTESTLANDFKNTASSRNVVHRSDTPTEPVPDDTELRERIATLEKLVENIPGHSITANPVSSVEDDRLRLLEGQIGKLVDALVTSSTKDKNQTKPSQETQTVIKDELKPDDRLEKIETQMNELMRKSQNGEQKDDKSFRKQKAALKLLENEMFGPFSPSSSSDDLISLPSKIPKRVLKEWLNIGKKTSLEYSTRWNRVYIDGYHPTSMCCKSKIVCCWINNRIKKSAKSKSGVKPDNSANTKVLSFLEAEERRLRGNELRYAERIKFLSSELEVEKGNGKRLADVSRHFLESKHKLEMLSAKFEVSEASKDALQNDLDAIKRERDDLIQRNRTLETKTDALENEANTIKPSLDCLKRENLDIKMELESTVKRCKALETELEECISAIKVYDHEKGKMGIRLIKEREQWKIKLAEIQKEKQITEENLQLSHRHAKHLENTLATKEETFKSKIEQILNRTSIQIESEVAKSTLAIEQVYKSQLSKTEDSLSKALQAYQNLEHEFRKIIGEEKRKFKSMEHHLGEKNRSLHVMGMREKEQTETIEGLIKLVKDLKKKLSSTTLVQDELERKYKVIVYII
jgi:leucine-rich repeat and coiled-coil domain-containing protein 1